jgi:hypothetical protein
MLTISATDLQTTIASRWVTYAEQIRLLRWRSQTQSAQGYTFKRLSILATSLSVCKAEHLRQQNRKR